MSFLISLLFCIGHAVDTNVVINTQLGQILGLEHVIKARQTVYSFYGIPYAIAPVGDLRWRPSQLQTTKWNGIYNATAFGDECVQFLYEPPPIGETMSENCLYLNIWTSKPNNTDTLLPVMFWIHGGGFITGSGSDLTYNGIDIVSQNRDFVYVSINYRLGIFGFLQNQALHDEDPNWPSYGGMNGVHDQIIALKWVKQYISDYGGDPNQITIFGESAGGLSLCSLAISRLASGLFQRGIIESGSCIGYWAPKNTSYGLQLYNDQLEQRGYPIDNLTYLRSIPTEELEITMAIPNAWQGSVDGLVLTDTPQNIYANLKDKTNVFNFDKMIIGFNTMDGVIGFPWHLGRRPTTDTQYKEFINMYISNETQQNLLYSFYYSPSDFKPYPPDHNSYELSWFTVTCDCCLTCPSLLIANQITEQLSNDVYVYQFGGPGRNGSYYAPHASELPFVFNKRPENEAFDMPWSQQLANEMMSSWTNFGKYGIPNITDLVDKINVDWTMYKDKNSVMMFRDTIKMNDEFETNYRNNVCPFWLNEVGVEIMTRICNDIETPN
eukprot:246586_1